MRSLLLKLALPSFPGSPFGFCCGHWCHTGIDLRILTKFLSFPWLTACREMPALA